MKGSHSKKSLAIGLTSIYFVSQVALGSAAEINTYKERSNVWKERARHTQMAALSPSAPALNPGSMLRELPPINGHLPSSAEWSAPKKKEFLSLSSSLQSLAQAIPLTSVSIQDVYDSESKLPPVLLIQDVHLNHEAQTNTALTVQELINQNQVGMVGVEGAFGKFDFESYRKYPNKKLNREVLSALLEQNLIGAPSFVGMSSLKTPPPFVGVDDRAHYDANLKALYASREQKKETVKQLVAFEKDLAEKKANAFSKELSAFDGLRQAYLAGKVGLGAYVKKLAAYGVETDFAIDQFLEAYNMELSLDFKRIEHERRRAIEKLAATLNEHEINALTNQSVAYRTGRLGFGPYYQGLRSLCAEKGVPLSQTPHFENYIRYVLLSDCIKADALFSAIEKLEKQIAVSLIRTPEEKELMAQSEWLTLAQKMVDFSLTPKEWTTYRSITKSQDPRTNSFHLNNFEDFYREADIRSEKMVDGLVLGSWNLALSKPKVLVVGGFHTPFISQLLRRKKTSYIVVSPKLTKIDDASGSAYLSVFAREKTPLDRLFVGEKLFINSEHLAVGTSSKAPVLTGLLLASALSILPGNAKAAESVAQLRHENIDYQVEYAPNAQPSAKALRQGTLRWGPVTVTREQQNWLIRQWGEIKIAVREFPYFAPVHFFALVAPLLPLDVNVLAWGLTAHAGMSLWFAKDHVVGRDGEALSLAQRAVIGMAGFVFGALLFIPDVTDNLGALSVFVTMTAHVGYNSMVAGLQSFGLLWLPFATQGNEKPQSKSEIKQQLSTLVANLTHSDSVFRFASQAAINKLLTEIQANTFGREDKEWIRATLAALVPRLSDENGYARIHSVWLIREILAKVQDDTFGVQDKGWIQSTINGLLPSLRHPNWDIRANSAEATTLLLARVQDDTFGVQDKGWIQSTINGLLPSLRHPNWEIRANGAEATTLLLARVQDDTFGAQDKEWVRSTISALLSNLSDADWNVRSEIAAAIDALFDKVQEGTLDDDRSMAQTVLKVQIGLSSPRTVLDVELIEERVIRVIGAGFQNAVTRGVMEQLLVGMWRQYQDALRRNPDNPELAEETFWNAVALLVKQADVGRNATEGGSAYWPVLVTALLVPLGLMALSLPMWGVVLVGASTLGAVAISKRGPPSKLVYELRVVVRELPYFLPVIISSIFLPVGVGLAVHALMSTWFAKAHVAGRDGQRLTLPQRIFIGVVGFVFGALLFIPGVKENLGALSVFVTMAVHLSYNLAVGLLRKMGIHWIPYATDSKFHIDPLEILRRAADAAFKAHGNPHDGSPKAANHDALNTRTAVARFLLKQEYVDAIVKAANGDAMVWADLPRLKALATSDKYITTPWMMAVMFMFIQGASGMQTIGLDPEGYMGILRDEIDESNSFYYRVVKDHEIFFFDGVKATELTEKDIEAIVEMSVELFRDAEKILGKSSELSENSVTIRELIRFYVDFCLYYLRTTNESGHADLGVIVRQFIVTAENIYGRVLETPAARDAFAKTLFHMLSVTQKGASVLFRATQLRQFSGDGGPQEIARIMNFSDYETTVPMVASSEFETAIHARVRRSAQTARPLLLVTNSNDAIVVENVLASLNAEWRFSASSFAKRKDFFGMLMPDKPIDPAHREAVLARFVQDPEKIAQAIRVVFDVPLNATDLVDEITANADALMQDEAVRSSVAVYLDNPNGWQSAMTWKDGFLVEVARQAEKNPDKLHRIIIDNAEALPGRVRVLLNPVLWEKQADIPDRRETVRIPSNVQFVFTMDESGIVRDDSFLNRVLVQFTSSFNLSKKGFIARVTGVTPSVEEKLTDLYYELRKASWADAHWSYSDLVHIARRVAGRFGERHSDRDGVREENMETYLWYEAYNYLLLNLPQRQDWKTLAKIMKEKAPRFDEKSPHLGNLSTVEKSGSKIRVDFDGFSIFSSNEDIYKWLEKQPKGKASAKDVLFGVYGFALTEMEERLLCQLARDWKYGSRSVEIEGYSGEGKTEISRVFAKLMGFKIAERTVNAATDLGDVRGRFVSSRNGQIKFEESDYIRELEEGGYVHIFNEVNTAPESRLYYWLYPEIARFETKLLPEFASQEKDESVRKIKPSATNMRIFTVNSESTAGREARPSRVGALVPRYRIFPDPQAVPSLIDQLFKTDSAALKDAFADVHTAIWKAQNETNLLESGQPVTRRFLFRTIERMKTLRATYVALSEQEAFVRAISDVYGLPWKLKSDCLQAQAIVRERLKKHHLEAPPVDALEALRLSLLEKSPTLVFQDASGANGGDIVFDMVKKNGPADDIVRIPLSFYHDHKQWVGSWMPGSRGMNIIARLIARLGGLRFQKLQYEIGLIGTLIRQARFNAASGRGRVVALLENYIRLSEKNMPLLNEFLQTGELGVLASRVTQDNADELWDSIKSQTLNFEILTAGFSKKISLDDLDDDATLRMEFARWFYSTQPSNLKLVATASAKEDVKIGGPELDRFTSVNISEPQTPGWAEATVTEWLKENKVSLDPKQRALVVGETEKALAAYTQLMSGEDGAVAYLRLSADDVHTFLAELLVERQAMKKSIEEFGRDVKKVGATIFGFGLPPAAREAAGFALSKVDRPQDAIGYRKDPTRNHWVFFADGFEILTRHPVDRPAPTRFLAPTQNHVHQMAALIVACRYHRMAVLEGLQGGGKSALVAALAQRLGVPHYDELMYDGIDLGGFFGRLSTKGNELILTAQPNDKGDFLLSFLNAYAHGGVVNLDEGAVGISSQKVIEFLASVAAMPELRLEHYHPGYRGPPIRRHPDFHLFVTQNPAGVTQDRLPVPYEADARSQKIWVDNNLSKTDALLIIDHHLGERYSGPNQSRDLQNIKDLIANIHLGFLNEHPAKDELSPRQLILMVLSLKSALDRKQTSLVDMKRAVFRGAMVAYFERLPLEVRPQLAHVLGGLAMEFAVEWQGPIVAAKNDFGGVAIPASAGKANVTLDQIRFPEELPSQNGALRALAYGLSLGMPVALVESNGADSLELVRKFAVKTDRELDILWSHADMTRAHLVEALMPVFEEEFDDNGVRRQSPNREFRQALGFLTNHMVPKSEYERMSKKSPHKEKILFFHMMDAIPERQRVVLNLFLSRMGENRTITVGDARGQPVEYILPPWINLVVSAPVNHRFSSPFMNRFLPIRVEPFSYDESRTLVHTRFPYVDDREFEWLWTISHAAVKMDGGSFEVGYGFSPEDIFKLAAAVQELKRRTWRPLKHDPLYYVIRAVQLVYLNALKDQDLKMFESNVVFDLILKVFRKPLAEKRVDAKSLFRYYSLLKNDMMEGFSFIGTQMVKKEIPLSKLSEDKDVVLPNGFRVHILKSEKPKVKLTTPAKSYEMTMEGLKSGGVTVTNEIRASVTKDDVFVLEYRVIKNVGGFDLGQDQWNIDRAIPIHEVPTQAFMEMTPQHAIYLAGVVNAWQSRADKTQEAAQARAPRVIMTNGETGVAKTASMVNLALVTGTPLYVLNSYEDMRVADVTMNMGVEQGQIQMNAKELLARIGRIRPKGSTGAWQKIKVPGKTTSSRSIVVWDEANVSTILAHPLAPLFRGEKHFEFHYLGETWEVEVEDEVLLSLTFNPVETYGDRQTFPKEITGYAHKFWPANPIRYADNQLKTILMELTRRGVRSVHEAIERRSGPPITPPESESYVKVRRHVLPSSHSDTADMAAAEEHKFMQTLKRYANPEVNNEWLEAILSLLAHAENIEGEDEAQDDRNETEQPTGKKEEPAAAPPAKEVETVLLTYNVADLKKAAAKFSGGVTNFAEYGESVIAPFLQAVSDLQFTSEHEENASIAQDVFSSARSVDRDLEKHLRGLFKMYLTGQGSDDDLQEHLMGIRRVLSAPGRDIYLIMQGRAEKAEDAAYLFINAQKIVDRFDTWDSSHYDILGVSPESPLRSQPSPQAIVLEGSPPSPGILGYWEGEFAVVFRDEIERLQSVPLNVAIPWVGYHEQGHMIDQRRYRAEGANDAPIPDNIELNSMLFPVIFTPPHIYLDDFARRMAKNLNPDNVYCQAIKGILNGLWKRALELKLVKDQFEMVNEDEWITDEMQDATVGGILDALKKLPEKEIQSMAAYIYQRRSTYLKTAKPGVQNVVLSDGDGWMEEFMAGVDKGYKTKVVGKIDGKKMVIESKNKKDRPKFKPRQRQPGDGKGGGGGKGKPRPGPDGGSESNPDKPGTGQKGDGDNATPTDVDLLDIPSVSAGALQKFMSLFAGAPNEIRFLSAEGEEISLEEFASSRGVSDFFVQVQQLKARTRGHFAVTMDVSGSTHGDVNRLFVEMARQFVALFHRAAARNPDVQAGVAVHGDDYAPLLNPRQSHKAPRVRQALSELSAYPADQGNDFQKVIEKIIAKHKKRTGLPILEIVITDGQVSVSEQTLWEAHQKGIDIVIVGYGTPSVLQFPKAINVPADTDSKGLLNVLLRVAELKAKRKDGKLPFDKNLGDRVGLTGHNIDLGGLGWAVLGSFVFGAVLIGLAGSVLNVHVAVNRLALVFMSPFLFFSVLAAIVALVHGFDTKVNASRPSYPSLFLWGRVAQYSASTSFVSYDERRDQFWLSPNLYYLLTSNRALSLLTQFFLNVFFIPLHERLHARGFQSELVPYVAQGLAWVSQAIMWLTLTSYFPLLSDWFTFALIVGGSALYLTWKDNRRGRTNDEVTFATEYLAALSGAIKQSDKNQPAYNLQTVERIMKVAADPTLSREDQGMIEQSLDAWVTGLTDSKVTVALASLKVLDKFFQAASPALVEKLKSEYIDRLIGALMPNFASLKGVHSTHVAVLKNLFAKLPESYFNEKKSAFLLDGVNDLSRFLTSENTLVSGVAAQMAAIFLSRLNQKKNSSFASVWNGVFLLILWGRSVSNARLKSVLLDLFTAHPEFMDQSHLEDILREGSSAGSWLPISLLDAFASNGATEEVRNAAKFLSLTASTLKADQYSDAVMAAVTSGQASNLLRTLSAALRNYEDIKTSNEKQAEAFVVEVWKLLTGGKEESHPIDLKGALAAFVLVSALTGALLAFVRPDTWEVLLFVPAIFGVIAFLALFFRVAAWWTRGRPITGPPVMVLWAEQLARADQNTAFVAWNPSLEVFDMNPALYRVLQANGFFAFVLQTLFYFTFVPLHEMQHRSSKSEWSAYGAQAFIGLLLTAPTVIVADRTGWPVLAVTLVAAYFVGSVMIAWNEARLSDADKLTVFTEYEARFPDSRPASLRKDILIASIEGLMGSDEAAVVGNARLIKKIIAAQGGDIFKPEDKPWVFRLLRLLADHLDINAGVAGFEAKYDLLDEISKSLTYNFFAEGDRAELEQVLLAVAKNLDGPRPDSAAQISEALFQRLPKNFFGEPHRAFVEQMMTTILGALRRHQKSAPLHLGRMWRAFFEHLPDKFFEQKGVDSMQGAFDSLVVSPKSSRQRLAKSLVSFARLTPSLLSENNFRLATASLREISVDVYRHEDALTLSNYFSAHAPDENVRLFAMAVRKALNSLRGPDVRGVELDVATVVATLIRASESETSFSSVVRLLSAAWRMHREKVAEWKTAEAEAILWNVWNALSKIVDEQSKLKSGDEDPMGALSAKSAIRPSHAALAAGVSLVSFVAAKYFTPDLLASPALFVPFPLFVALLMLIGIYQIGTKNLSTRGYRSSFTFLGRAAVSDPNTRFLAYDSGLKLFRVNFLLARAMRSSGVGSFLTKLELMVLNVPLHEWLHSKGLKSEWLAYFVQAATAAGLYTVGSFWAIGIWSFVGAVALELWDRDTEQEGHARREALLAFSEKYFLSQGDENGPDVGMFYQLKRDAIQSAFTPAEKDDVKKVLVLALRRKTVDSAGQDLVNFAAHSSNIVKAVIAEIPNNYFGPDDMAFLQEVVNIIFSGAPRFTELSWEQMDILVTLCKGLSPDIFSPDNKPFVKKAVTMLLRFHLWDFLRADWRDAAKSVQGFLTGSPKGLFDGKDPDFLTEILEVLSGHLGATDSANEERAADLNQLAGEILVTLFTKAPVLMTEKNFMGLLDSRWGGERLKNSRLTLLKMFDAEGMSEEVRIASRVLSKTLEEPAFSSVRKQDVYEFLDKAANDPKQLMRLLVLLGRGYDDKKTTVGGDEAEGFFWTFWDLVVRDVKTPSPTDENGAIDFGNALAALAVTITISGVLGIVLTGGTFAMDWRLATFLLVLPSLFALHVVLVLMVMTAEWLTKGHPITGPPVAEAFRKVVRPATVNFMQYDQKSRLLYLNPVLYRLVISNVVVSFLTKFVLSALFIPMHEWLHGKGLKNEGVVYGLQSLFVLWLVVTPTIVASSIDVLSVHAIGLLTIFVLAGYGIAFLVFHKEFSSWGSGFDGYSQTEPDKKTRIDILVALNQRLLKKRKHAFTASFYIRRFIAYPFSEPFTIRDRPLLIQTVQNIFASLEISERLDKGTPHFDFTDDRARRLNSWRKSALEVASELLHLISRIKRIDRDDEGWVLDIIRKLTDPDELKILDFRHKDPVLITLLKLLRENYFGARNEEIVAELINRISSKKVFNSIEVLVAICEFSPVSMDMALLGRLIQQFTSMWEMDYPKFYPVFELFAKASPDEDVRNAAKSIVKVLAEDKERGMKGRKKFPPMKPWRSRLDIVLNDAVDVPSFLTFLGGVWRLYEDQRHRYPEQPAVAEATFRNALKMYEDQVSPVLPDELGEDNGTALSSAVHPINLKNSVKALVVSGGVAGIVALSLWLTTGQASAYLWSDILIFGVPLVFFAQFVLIKGLQAVSQRIQSPLPAGSSALLLFERIAYAVPGTALIEYDADEDAFHLNPVLSHALAGHWAVSIFSKMVLALLFIPYHEKQHRNGEKSEWRAYFVQAAAGAFLMWVGLLSLSANDSVFKVIFATAAVCGTFFLPFIGGSVDDIFSRYLYLERKPELYRHYLHLLSQYADTEIFHQQIFFNSLAVGLQSMPSNLFEKEHKPLLLFIISRLLAITEKENKNNALFFRHTAVALTSIFKSAPKTYFDETDIPMLERTVRLLLVRGVEYLSQNHWEDALELVYSKHYPANVVFDQEKAPFVLSLLKLISARLATRVRPVGWGVMEKTLRFIAARASRTSLFQETDFAALDAVFSDLEKAMDEDGLSSLARRFLDEVLPAVPAGFFSANKNRIVGILSRILSESESEKNPLSPTLAALAERLPDDYFETEELKKIRGLMDWKRFRNPKAVLGWFAMKTKGYSIDPRTNQRDSEILESWVTDLRDNNFSVRRQSFLALKTYYENPKTTVDLSDIRRLVRTLSLTPPDGAILEAVELMKIFEDRGGSDTVRAAAGSMSKLLELSHHDERVEFQEDGRVITVKFGMSDFFDFWGKYTETHFDLISSLSAAIWRAYQDTKVRHPGNEALANRFFYESWARTIYALKSRTQGEGFNGETGDEESGSALTPLLVAMVLTTFMGLGFSAWGAWNLVWPVVIFGIWRITQAQRPKIAGPSIRRLLDVVDDTPLNLHVGGLWANGDTGPLTTPIMIHLVDDAAPTDAFESARQQVEHARAKRQEVIFRFFTANQLLAKRLETLKDPMTNVDVEVYDRRKISTLSEALRRQAVFEFELADSFFRFFAPEKMKEELAEFLDFENIPVVDLVTQANRFHFHLILERALNPLTIEVQFDQLRRLDELDKTIRAVLQAA